MQQWLGFLRSLVIYNNPVTLRAWRRLYGGLLDPQDLVFDVGAHIGNRSRAMRAAGARVVAIEPQQPFAGFLRRTLPYDIALIDAAVGRDEVEAEMAVSSRHPTVSSLQADFVSSAADAPGFGHVRWDATQQVRMVTLDGLIARFGLPRYVKIDVEGYELEVLAGLSHPVPILSVEFLPGFSHLTDAVIDRLAELGEYRFNPVQGERSGLLWPEWRDGAAVKAWVGTLPADAPSGDLFARLPQDGPRAEPFPQAPHATR